MAGGGAVSIAHHDLKWSNFMLTCAACTGGAAACPVSKCTEGVQSCTQHMCKVCRWSVVLIDLANANVTRQVWL